MDVKKLEQAGDIKEGDLIVISATFASKPFACNALAVLSAGTDKEEVIYNQGKNHYFITSMVLDGTSRVGEVLIIRNTED